MIKEIQEALSRVEAKYVTRSALGYEKMFHYELYHQIRTTGIHEYELTPEFYKEAKYFVENPFHERTSSFIPDLLIHDPMTKSRQGVAIEIKNVERNDVGSLYRDLKKLMCYCHQSEESLQYKYGILIVYGDGFVEKIHRSRTYKPKIRDLYRYAYNPVEIWHIDTNRGIEKYGRSNIELILT